jgi:hypothetical protein
MGGTELVYKLFEDCKPGNKSGLCVLDPPTQALPIINALLIALVIKGGLTVITFGIKVPAGIFIPTLGVGACAGRIVGILVQWMQAKSTPDSGYFTFCRGDLDCVVPGLYAMVGAAATLSGVTVRIIHSPHLWPNLTLCLASENDGLFSCYYVRVDRYPNLRCPCHAFCARRQDCR